MSPTCSTTAFFYRSSSRSRATISSLDCGRSEFTPGVSMISPMSDEALVTSTVVPG